MLNLLSNDALQLRGHGDAECPDRLVHELRPFGVALRGEASNREAEKLLSVNFLTNRQAGRMLESRDGGGVSWVNRSRWYTFVVLLGDRQVLTRQ